jgi:hypothetical protein
MSFLQAASQIALEIIQTGEASGSLYQVTAQGLVNTYVAGFGSGKLSAFSPELLTIFLPGTC